MSCDSCQTVQWNKHSSAPYAMFEQSLTFQDNKHDSADYSMFEQSLYRVVFKNGEVRTLPLDDNAINYYNNLGALVVPVDTAFQLSDVSIRLRNVENNQMTIGKNMTKIGEDNVYFGESINRIDTSLKSLQNQINTAKAERDSIQSKFSAHANIPHGGNGGISLPFIGSIGTTGLIVGGLALYLLARKK